MILGSPAELPDRVVHVQVPVPVRNMDKKLFDILRCCIRSARAIHGPYVGYPCGWHVEMSYMWTSVMSESIGGVVRLGGPFVRLIKTKFKTLLQGQVSCCAIARFKFGCDDMIM